MASPVDPATLYTRFYGVVFSMAYHLTGGNVAESEDLVQDTFVRALTHAVPPDYPDHWLKTVCKRLVIERSRRARIIRWEPWGPATPEGVDAQTPETLLLRQEAQAATAAALAPRWALLSPRAQAILWAFHEEGRSLGEIAAGQGRSVSAVKSEAFAARRLAQRGYRPRRGRRPKQAAG
jgi:RNA polymerase sigma factor (sigma-70 family)